MKRILFTFCMGFAVMVAHGQQKQGRVVYARTVQMQFTGGMTGAEDGPPLPREHTIRQEVLFANDQCVRRGVGEEPEAFEDGGRRIQFHVAGGGPDDLTYVNFTTGQIMEQREFGAKNYIVTDSVHKLNWKLTGQTKTIFNYTCQQAVTQSIGKRAMTTIENGQMKTKEVADTSEITVWFTLAIPVPAGPEYQGQLPGLILAIDINNGRTVYQAVEISPDVTLAAIKPPTKGKKLTAAEFIVERDKVLAEMARNGEGIRMIRIGN